MEKKRLETKVGLFVFLGLALLATLLLQFSKSTSLWRGTYELHLHAVNVGGIKPRAGVLLAGVQVGSVAGINLAPDGKSVTMNLKIYNEFPIYHDARFVIEQSGFLGDQFVSILPTTNAAQVGLAVRNVVQFSTGLIELENSARDVLATNRVNINQATKDVADAAASFRQIAADLQAGRGLAGAFLQNPELATNVQNI